MNLLYRQDDSEPDKRASAYRDAVRSDCTKLDAEWFSRWRRETGSYTGLTPVFLVGFPRSGTTLLDTILLGHPGIEILEEEPALREANDSMPDLEQSLTATDAQIATARERYFEVAARFTPLVPGKVLVDKNPLHMNKLPFIHRLFPHARIILAVRHPCDVVLSCYITNFALNAGMSNFLTLETAAELYDLSFGFAEKARSLMSLPMHTVIYENIVADRERELRPLFDFMGLGWSDAVLDHQATARSRERIKTASYSQVVEPIYTRAAGRWLRYRKHLEPILPILAPWVEKFGYEL